MTASSLVDPRVGCGAPPAAAALHLLLPASFALQGSIEPKRRDYAGAFAAASHPAVLEQLRARNESLLIVGSGSGKGLDIPAALQPFVRILSSLPYEARMGWLWAAHGGAALRWERAAGSTLQRRGRWKRAGGRERLLVRLSFVC